MYNDPKGNRTIKNKRLRNKVERTKEGLRKPSITQGRIAWIVIMQILIGISVVTDMTFFSILGTAIAFILVCTEDETADFYVFAGLIALSGYINVEGRSIMFALLLISSGKLIYNHSQGGSKASFLILITGLLSIEIINDASFGKAGEVLHVISLIVYFISFVSYSDVDKIDYARLKNLLLITFLIPIIINIILAEGNIFDLATSDEMVRFGEQERRIGGAMGIPIYCCFIITICLQDKIMETNTIPNWAVVIMIIFAFSIGFTTISRVYLLGLSIILACLFYVMVKGEFSGALSFFILVCAIVCAAIYFKPDLIYGLFDKFSERGSQDFSTGRSSIYEDCMKYLSSHPKAVLLGEGAKRYPFIGVQKGLMFSMLAHNLYLDAIMSWGIMGSYFIIHAVFTFIVRCRKVYGKPQMFFAYTPLLLFLATHMTGGTFGYFNVYMYIFISVLLIFSGKDNIIAAEEERKK